ncbi:MAG: hypothetical protein KJZ65_07955 [Phycisphaerales bacterium]|nr:hypothetical protein [Phycisphaerales bacterium]
MRSALTIGLIAQTLALATANAQVCPFSVTHNADSLNVTCTEVSSGVWDLKLTIVDDGTPTVTVTVNDMSGGGSPTIRDLVFDLTNNSGNGPYVSAVVKGPTGDELNLAGLSSVTVDTDTGGELYLVDLRVGGDLGSVTAQRLDSLRTTGDVTGDITILEVAGVFSGSIGTLVVDGDFLGSIDFDPNDTGSKIDTLSVGGDIGTSMSPVSISASATIGLISCDTPVR